MRNLTPAEWAVTITALWLVLGLGIVLDADPLRWVAATGFAVLVIERVINIRRNKRGVK